MNLTLRARKCTVHSGTVEDGVEWVVFLKFLSCGSGCGGRVSSMDFKFKYESLLSLCSKILKKKQGRDTMAREKPKKTWIRQITYSQSHWNLLKEKRKKATAILETLREAQIKGYVYGSVARGDINEKSDIDIITFSPPTPFLLERALNRNFSIYEKEISQATPKLAIKGHIHLDNTTTITFPITKLSKAEREFYTYGGKLTLPEVKDYEKRVPGIDKRLLLIEPTESGHKEMSILGREKKAATTVGVSVGLVLKREKLLRRRDEKGRSGPFIRKKVRKGESFDSILRQIASQNAFLREELQKR